MQIPVFFHPEQLAFKPRYEWAFGERIDHPETTARAESILRAVQADPGVYGLRLPEPVGNDVLRLCHSVALLTVYDVASSLPDGEDHYPTVFPRDPDAVADPTNLRHAGAWCFDAGTPLSARTSVAARWSAACAWDAAGVVLRGEAPAAYALSRPPGHHASQNQFGGYCYVNNGALAAHRLRAAGMRVLVLDIDFHHGDGTQSLFWNDPQVLTVSIHGDPNACFPYHAGYEGERGGPQGGGANLNVPLPMGTEGAAWLDAFHSRVRPFVDSFSPDALVLAAGIDAYRLDPVGHFGLTTEDFERIGFAVGSLGLPTVAVQEGGYHTAHLGTNVDALLRGLRDGLAAGRVVFVAG